MANVKQAEKRNRQNIKRRERNRANKSIVKNAAAKVMDIIRTDVKSAKKVLVESAAIIAKAAHKGAVPKGRASRKISRLAKAVNKATATSKSA
ncbi:MAG: 30S ribosomal protein S20 [Bdellovibrionota bacterium]